MYAAELILKGTHRNAVDGMPHAIVNLLLDLNRGGRILDRDPVPLPTRGGYKVIVFLPAPDALDESKHRKPLRMIRSDLKHAGWDWTGVRILGKEVDSADPCSCRKLARLILITDACDWGSPLSCGDCGGTVPLYRLPPTSEVGNYEDIIFFARRYRVMDKLWLGSGTGERFAYRELSRIDSELSVEGRDLCRRIEKSSGIAVYYYVMRYYGKSLVAERKCPCPGCGRKWFIDEPGVHDFHCDRCRLVSDIAAELTVTPETTTHSVSLSAFLDSYPTEALGVHRGDR